MNKLIIIAFACVLTVQALPKIRRIRQQVYPGPVVGHQNEGHHGDEHYEAGKHGHENEGHHSEGYDHSHDRDHETHDVTKVVKEHHETNHDAGRDSKHQEAAHKNAGYDQHQSEHANYGQNSNRNYGPVMG